MTNTEQRSGKSKTLTPEQLDQVIHHLPSYKHQILALVCRNCACESRKLRFNLGLLEDDQLLSLFVTKGRLNTGNTFSPKFIKTLKE